MMNTRQHTQTESRPQHVLVVDDDRSLRFHATNVLVSAGINVTEAEHGPAAIEIVKQQSFDAILIDVHMPDMDGFSVCHEIRKIKSGEFLPIIMLTGQSDSEAIEKAFRSGATDFETKPVNWTKLKNRIRYLINTREMARDLVSSEKHRHALLDTIPDTVLTLNSDGIVLDAKFATIGFDTSNLSLKVGEKFYQALPKASRKVAKKALSNVSYGLGNQQIEIEILKDKQLYYLEVRMVLVSENTIIAMFRDFTERNRAEKKIEHLAFNDLITTLPNKLKMDRDITSYLSEQNKRSQKLYLLNIGISGLEHAHSLLGHDFFNLLLRQISSRLKISFQRFTIGNSIYQADIYRLSEAVFSLVIAEDLDKKEVEVIIDLLQKAIDQEYIIGEYEINLTSRVGVAKYPDDDINSLRLIEKANVALENSSNQGVMGACFYSNEIHQKIVRKACITKDLRLAIDNGDLKLVYQPKVNANTQQLIGVEALVRWQDKKSGFISPADFIPIAEDNGLILRLGDYVLNEACRQSRSWLDSGYQQVPVAVNFSGHQLNHHGLIDNLVNTLDRYQLNNDQIELELTESVAFKDTNHVKSILAELRRMGFRMSIDDFGTGYSSLSSLSKLPFNTLKIDRSFIMDLVRSASMKSVVEGIINMAHAMNMVVVAEGVEEQHQLEFLQSKNCDVIQGYLTGRPACAEDIENMLMPARLVQSAPPLACCC